MRKLSFFLILGTLLFSFITLGIDEASASCAPSPFAGQWVNDSNEPSLVKRVEITIPCTDTFDQGIGGTDDYAMPPANLPMFYTIALCQSGDCVWGWSPGRRDGNNYADRRHWINATTDQTFQALPDGKLRVTTTVNFNNGTRQVFTDILHRISSKMQGAVPELFVITSFKVLTATPDGDISASWRCQ